MFGQKVKRDMSKQPGLSSVRTIEENRALELQWNDGERSRFHAFWLRDNALDEKTRSTGNSQRLITLDEIPENITVDTIEAESDGLKLRFMPDQHTVNFPLAWLWSHRYDLHTPSIKGRMPTGSQGWTSEFSLSKVTAHFDGCASDSVQLMRWLSHVRRFGVGLLRAGPVEPSALLSIVDWFGYIRRTNYGEFFDVRTSVNPANLAYTSLGLQAHTDNPYRDPAPTLQILYCLENSAEGGESQIVDGFQAAQRLRDEDPDGFDCLTRYCARFKYSGTGDVHLSARKPIVEMTPDGELYAVRFNNRSAAPIVDVPYEQMPLYYRAYRHYAKIVDDPAMNITFKLEPGESFIVDNTRVLHGRTGYSSSKGSRWLQGCYADKDGLLSTLAVLEKNLGKVNT